MFNQKIPSPVPATDLETLARIISAPQKAAELFDKYRAAREEYEALRASIAAEMAVAKQADAELTQKQADTVVGLSDLEAAKKKFQDTQLSWEKNKQAVEASLADRANVLSGKEAAVVDANACIAKKQIELSEQSASQNKWYADKLLEVQDANEKLAAREAAVAAREEKAEQLAKLLKGV